MKIIHQRAAASILLLGLALMPVSFGADACGGLDSCPGQCEAGVCSLGVCAPGDPEVPLLRGTIDSYIEPGLDQCFGEYPVVEGSQTGCVGRATASVKFEVEAGTVVRLDSNSCGTTFDTFLTLNRINEDGTRECLDLNDNSCLFNARILHDLGPGVYQINLCGEVNDNYGDGDGVFKLSFEKRAVPAGSCGGLDSCPGVCVDNVCDLGTCSPDDPDVELEIDGGFNGAFVEPGIDACGEDDELFTCVGRDVGSIRFEVLDGTSVSLDSGPCDALGPLPPDTYMTLNRISADGSRTCVEEEYTSCDVYGELPSLTQEALPAGSYQVNICGFVDQPRSYTLAFSKTVDGGVQGDPHMTGFDGSHFDYTGEPGAVFSVVSTPDFQVNAMLMPDLAEGLTYVGALGITSGTGHTASVRAAVVADHLVVVLDDVVVELTGDGAQGGDIHLAAVGNGDVEVSVPGLVMVVEVHRSIFLNIKSARLTAAHSVIDGVLGETARAGRTVTAGIEHEESHYFVDSLLTHSMAGHMPVRKMGAALKHVSTAGLDAAAAMVHAA